MPITGANIVGNNAGDGQTACRFPASFSRLMATSSQTTANVDHTGVQALTYAWSIDMGPAVVVQSHVNRSHVDVNL